MGDDDPDPDRRETGPGRRGAPLPVLVVSAVCVLVAVSVVVFADDVRWLRVGVVAALWAALAAVWALQRRASEPDSESLRRTYELELAAEIDARRAHEHTVEQTVRRELESERSGEIDALRGELERLRGALEQRPPEAAPVRETRLHVVGGSSVGPEGDVADLRTGGIASPPAPWPSSSPSGPPAVRRHAVRGRMHDARAPGAAPGHPAAGPPPPAPSAPSRGPGTAGRTVAELLAAHATATAEGPAIGSGRRRRDR